MSTDSQRGYQEVEDWKWRSYDGKHRIDLDKFIEESLAKENMLFFVGTDSQNYSKKKSCTFTTVLIAYKMGLGGKIVVAKEKRPFISSLRQRLLTEAMRSLELAWHLDSRIPRESFVGIHLDVNDNLQYKSAKYKDELVGLVMAQGYKALVKPDAWAASTVADTRC